MTTWILIGVAVVVMIGIVGLVMLVVWDDIPDDEMPERWRAENERDRGKQ